MPEERAALFISHKVAIHKRAAARIKAVLEGRANRLDVYICEEIPAGDSWRQWIAEHLAHSNLLLVLLPRAGADLVWIADELGRFEAGCPKGRIVVLKYPSDPVPSIVGDRQIVDITSEHLRDQFLGPLYLDKEFTGLDVPLNGRVAEVDVLRDAEQLEAALLGDLTVRAFGESLVVDISGRNVSVPEDLGKATVQAPNGCNDILDWDIKSFSWAKLREKAAEQKGRGTFWVTEMEQVIRDVASQRPPRIMTSTFRARGRAAGQIFSPQLEQVEYIDEVAQRFHFAFHEVLAPELVRGSGPIGAVFNVLHMATRVRWEVLDPFLGMSKAGEIQPSDSSMDQDEEQQLLNRVKTSLRIIEVEAERHKMIEEALNAFEGHDRAVVSELLKRRQSISEAIDHADSVHMLMSQLIQGLGFNCEVTEVLATKYLDLVRQDRQRVGRQLQVEGKPL